MVSPSFVVRRLGCNPVFQGWSFVLVNLVCTVSFVGECGSTLNCVLDVFTSINDCCFSVMFMMPFRQNHSESKANKHHPKRKPPWIVIKPSHLMIPILPFTYGNSCDSLIPAVSGTLAGSWSLLNLNVPHPHRSSNSRLSFFIDYLESFFIKSFT